MADGSDNTDDKLEDDKTKTPPADDKTKTDEKHEDTPALTEEQRLQALIDAQLKPIKSKLDEAYAARDEAAKKVKDFEKKERDAELKRLEDAGQLKEAYEGRLADAEAARVASEKRVVELTRDLELKGVLSTLTFRNEKAREMAFQEMVGQLTQTDKGDWVHKTGASVSDAVKKFAEDESNAFLFKSKASSGAGTDTTTPTDTKKKSDSVFGMTQSEVLQRAREGTLPKTRR